MMHVVVIDATGAALEAADKAAEEKGLRWASSSNTGLPRGKMRVTYLPHSAFTTPRAGKEDTASRVVGRR
jgi:hypothetical protein